MFTVEQHCIKEQALISRLDSRTLRPVNVLGLLVFNITHTVLYVITRDIKRQITECP